MESFTYVDGMDAFLNSDITGSAANKYCEIISLC